MSTQSTPGPWEIVWERDTEHEPPRRAESVGPVSADHDHWSGWTICDEADACLIAAAPSLLKALKAFLNGDASVSHMKVAYQDARIAVAEAEGELRK